MLRGESAGAVPKSFVDGVNAALALNGFDQDGTNRVVELGFKISEVVEADEFDSGNDRRKRQAVFFRGCDADGAERPPMKRIFESEETMFLRRRACWRIGMPAKEPRQLHRAINRFRAAIGEEHAIHARPINKLARQRTLKRVVVEVGKMDGARGFAANHFDNARMRVAKRVDGNAPKKIEIFLARRVEDVRTLAVGHDHGLALVGGQEILLRIPQARVELGSRQLLKLLYFGTFLG